MSSWLARVLGLEGRASSTSAATRPVRPIKWERLNTHWSAEPNAPRVAIRTESGAVILRFDYTTTAPEWKAARPDDLLELVFHRCYVYRLGPENMDAFYFGQSRYSNSGMEWGEFYQVHGRQLV